MINMNFVMWHLYTFYFFWYYNSTNNCSACTCYMLLAPNIIAFCFSLLNFGYITVYLIYTRYTDCQQYIRMHMVVYIYIYISSIQISKMGNKIALLERWCTTTFSWCRTWGKLIQEKWETKSFVSSIRWPWNAKDDLEFIRSLKIKSIVMCFTNHSLAHALYFTL